jgi:antitoxin CptB
MMKQESGARNQESDEIMLSLANSNPESGILIPETARRLRWRCRRGMLELDIVLGRFLERHYASIDEAQRTEFDALLDMSDVVLWDMIMGRASPPRGDAGALLELLRTA